MPFCTHCGNQVETGDRYCARCGAKQSSSPGSASTASTVGDLTRGLSPRTAALICYIPVMGWIAAVVVLASPRFLKDRIVRFHAFQGLYLFVAWLLIKAVAVPLITMGHDHGPTRAIAGILHVAMVGLWVFMLIKTSQGEMVSLPIAGELAERSVAEQRQP